MNDSQPITPYFSHGRSRLRYLVRGRGLRVLELGCASGVLGASLLQDGTANVVDGVEGDGPAASLARDRLTHVWSGDLNTFDFSTVGSEYDALVAADVLEHLIDPWQVLAEALTRLRSGGQVVVSLPNVRYYRVVYGLAVRGRFDYEAAGVLDRTHLRFFTRQTAVELLQSNGLREVHAEPAEPGRTGFKRLIGNLFTDFTSPQIYLSAVKVQ